MFCGVADGGHDGGGRSQHQGARTEDDEDRDGPNDLAGDKPGQGGGSQGDDHDPGGPAVRKPHDLGLARIRRLHQPDHPLDGAVLSHLDSFHFKGAELIYCAAGHPVPHGFIHRQGFAGHHRLVDGGLAGNNGAVHRHAFTGQDPDAVTDLHLLGGDD